MTELTTYRGMLIRSGGDEERFDQDVYKEAHAYFRHLPVHGATVLDIGAHYGMFSSMAIQKGAYKVVSVEPDLFNYEIALRNIEKASNYIRKTTGRAVDIFAINKAVVGDTIETPKLTLYKHKKYTAAISAFPSIRSMNELEQVTVKTVSFKYLLSMYSPSVVKIDCEGCEYELLSSTVIPDYVEHILVEFHRHRKDLRDRFDEAVEVFKDWRCSKQAKPNWHCVTGAWHRR